MERHGKENMKKTILSAKNVSKSLAYNGTQVRVLSNVNLDICEGDFTVIMGASGSGNQGFFMR